MQGSTMILGSNLIHDGIVFFREHGADDEQTPNVGRDYSILILKREAKPFRRVGVLERLGRGIRESTFS
jgi:hypothetical protein